LMGSSGLVALRLSPFRWLSPGPASYGKEYRHASVSSHQLRGADRTSPGSPVLSGISVLPVPSAPHDRNLKNSSKGILYRLHQITPFQLPILSPTHAQPTAPPAVPETIIHRPLFQRAILQCCPPNLRFPVLVSLEYVEQFLLVCFTSILDFVEGLVFFPEVSVAAIGEE